MTPETIPWILCGALCLLPVALGFGSYQFMCLVTNRHFAWEHSVHTDEDGIKHVHSELTWLTREERKSRGKQEEEE
jgi:hypothetical protein